MGTFRVVLVIICVYFFDFITAQFFISKLKPKKRRGDYRVTLFRVTCEGNRLDFVFLVFIW